MKEANQKYFPVSLDSFEIFDRTFQNLKTRFLLPSSATLPQFFNSGTIGTTLLKKTRMTMDYAGQQMWIEWLPPMTRETMQSPGFDVNKKDLGGNTPLMIAAYYNQPKNVKIFLDKGADIHIKTPDGWTALKIAKIYDHSEIYSLLEKAGAKE